MTLTKYRNEIPTVPYLLDNLFGKDLFDFSNSSSTHTTLPAVNIQENKEQFVVEVAAPGMEKTDFKVKLENNLLTISSEKQTSNEESEKDGKFTRREFSYQSFRRSFTLPHTIEREQISAAYENGVLRIVLPKKEEAKEKPAKEIQVS